MNYAWGELIYAFYSTVNPKHVEITDYDNNMATVLPYLVMIPLNTSSWVLSIVLMTGNPPCDVSNSNLARSWTHPLEWIVITGLDMAWRAQYSSRFSLVRKHIPY